MLGTGFFLIQMMPKASAAGPVGMNFGDWKCRYEEERIQKEESETRYQELNRSWRRSGIKRGFGGPRTKEM